MITFLVVGRNESATLHNSLSAAQRAVRAEDVVRYVDSGSTDDSVDIARQADVAVILSSEGKGRALQDAFATVATEWVCTIDGDLQERQSDVAVRLAGAVRRADPEVGMIIGEFVDVRRGLMATTNYVYRPLVDHFFPELAPLAGCRTPLSGFRALRTLALRQCPAMPDGFGVEAHLNVETSAAGWRAEAASVGELDSVFRFKRNMGLEIANSVISSAVRHSRLTEAQSELFTGWAEDVVQVIGSYQLDDEGGRQRLLRQISSVVAEFPVVDRFTAPPQVGRPS